jgi:transcriptional regulator GlxA family with amidase domain
LRQRVEGDLRGLSTIELAREARLSVHHFSRAFRRSFGQSPGRWLTDRRIDRARELLTTTDRGVVDIARTVGYSGAPQLARPFHARFGVSPLAYRRR